MKMYQSDPNILIEMNLKQVQMREWIILRDVTRIIIYNWKTSRDWTIFT